MKPVTILFLLTCLIFLYACKKEKSDSNNDVCHLPVTASVSHQGIDSYICGTGGGVYPDYFCGPMLPTHGDRVVFDNINHTLYIEEIAGNIKGVILDVGAHNCAYINDNWNYTPTTEVTPFTSGHCYFGLFPDGDTLKFYAQANDRDPLVLIDFLFDTARIPQHDSIFVGRYYDENNYLGGVFAYILQPGDPGYSLNLTHGLIAMPNDIIFAGNHTLPWWNGGYTITGATDSVIGSGQTNTNLIISSQGPGIYPAGMCVADSVGGYSGWFLPSIHELRKLYLNRSLIGGFDTISFNAVYWSSTEFDEYSVCTQDFGSPFGFTTIDKRDFAAIRAIRRF
jgi:hypothetical protein